MAFLRDGSEPEVASFEAVLSATFMQETHPQDMSAVYAALAISSAADAFLEEKESAVKQELKSVKSYAQIAEALHVP